VAGDRWHSLPTTIPTRSVGGISKRSHRVRFAGHGVNNVSGNHS